MLISASTLSGFDIFRNTTPAVREKLADVMTSQEFLSGNFIISQTQNDAKVFFIISGVVRACVYSHSGKQVHFEDLPSGMMFGELAAIDGGDRTSDCIAVQNTRVAVLTRDQFLNILDEHNDIRQLVMQRLVKMIRHQMQRVYEFTSYGVSQRVRFELLRLLSQVENVQEPVRLTNIPTQSEIADRISSHREAVSREIKKLETAGFITWSRDVCMVHDVEGLLKHSGM